MQKITLYKEQPESATSVPNIFIDEFMTQANGEYVKIYLYLLRTISTGTPSADFSLSQVADHFDCTEKDVVRALNYWERLRLFRLEYDKEHNLSGICLPAGSAYPENIVAEADCPGCSTGSLASESAHAAGSPTGDSCSAYAAAESPSGDSRLAYAAAGSPTGDSRSVCAVADPCTNASGRVCAADSGSAAISGTSGPTAASWGAAPARRKDTSPKNLTNLFIQTCSLPQQADLAEKSSFSTFCEKEEVQEIVFIAEQYLGRTLSHPDLNYIYSWYTEFCLSAELIEYIIETSVAAGHTSLHYMHRIAEDYAARNITTPEQAKELSNQNSAVCYAVMKAFGIRGRHLAPSEMRYLRNWSEKMGFGIDLITEACSRTIKSIHEPSFGYANSILERWQKQNIHSLEEVARSDAAYKQSQDAGSHSSKKSSVQTANHFANFRQRDNDYDEIQRMLIQNSMQ